MAVRHVTIHECDLCGSHTDPKNFVKLVIGMSRYDTCPKCAQRLRSTIKELEVQAHNTESK